MAVGPFEPALDYAPTGIALLTESGCIRWTNRRLSRMLRRDADEMVGIALAAFTDPEDDTDEPISAGHAAALFVALETVTRRSD